jgi:hypothetical protein
MEASGTFKGLDIEQINADSREYIKWIINRGYDDVLFYLDAHWEDTIPLAEELNEIMKQPKFLVILHDVAVNDQRQFVCEPGVDYIWRKYMLGDAIPIGTTAILPKYNIMNHHPPHYLVGYCIISKGYPQIDDPRFMLIERTAVDKK